MTSFLPVLALWRREVLRFVRQRSRVTGALLQPLVFWALLGGGLNASFRPAGLSDNQSYAEYFYPGMIGMVLLFTAIFATISTVEDRKEGFLQGVMVAPVSRASIVFGQALGGTTLAVGQGVLCLLLAPFVGIHLSFVGVIGAIILMFLMAVALTSLGLMIAWKMDSTQGFHAIMNLVLLPIWLLSGAFFPAAGAPRPLSWLITINPLTYGMAGLRRCLYVSNPALIGPVPGALISSIVTLLFCAGAFYGAVATASRKAL